MTQRIAVLLMVMGLACGCTPRAVVIQQSAEIPKTFSPAEFDRLLHRVVKKEDVDLKALLENRSLLDRFLVQGRRFGPNLTPDLFPSQADRLAYLINFHNAAMLSSLVAVVPQLPEGEVGPMPAGLERKFHFDVDGSLRSPADMAREAIALAGDDHRVRFALSTLQQVGPPMSGRIFTASLLPAQLDAVMARCLESERVVKIDHGEIKQLLVWRGLFDIREQLIAEYETRFYARGATMLSVLLEWSGRIRRETLNSAVGYVVAAMPENRVPAIVGLRPATRPLLDIFPS